MSSVKALSEIFLNQFSDAIQVWTLAHNELTIECAPNVLRDVAHGLRDKPELQFNQLIDLSAVDYLHFGLSDEDINDDNADHDAINVEQRQAQEWLQGKARFAVVYHLMSTVHNHRIRLKVFLKDQILAIHSVHDIWQVANWYEREAYDLFGILFEGHPDLRRILTDYGFIGHPFRKDFPLIGHVEMRYDAKLAKVIYEPVSIEPRVTVPKVIRNDNRYLESSSTTK